MLNKYIYFLIFKGTDFSFRYKVMCTVDIKEYNKKKLFRFTADEVQSGNSK